MTQPEKKLELLVKEYINKISGFVFKINQPGFRTRNIKGLPDLVALKNGVVLFLEIKSPGGIQSKYQKNIEDIINKNKGKYYIIYSIKQLYNIIKKEW